MQQSLLSNLSWKRVIPVLIFLVLLVGLAVLLFMLGRDPVVEALEPSVVREGEALEISGRLFGDAQGTVTIAGIELPSSAIREWSDSSITLTVPVGTDSGLLFVGTDGGSSSGSLVRMVASVPRSDAPAYAPGSPEIVGLESDVVRVGGILVIQGRNFGRQRRTSRVLFTAATDSGRTAPLPAEISYPEWSDDEIHVRVPDGVVSGLIAVDTAWGRSNPLRLSIDRPAGQMRRGGKSEISVRYGASVAGGVGDRPSGSEPGGTDIVVWLPQLVSTPFQVDVRYLERETENDVPSSDLSVSPIRFENVEDGFSATFMRNVVALRYEAVLDVDPSRISPVYESESGFFSFYTSPTPLLPARDEALVDVAAELRRGRASPYQIALAAYDWLLDRMEYSVSVPDRSALAGLEQGYGDDHTYSVLFVSVMRAARIPTRLVSGVVASGDGHVYPHFWAEFFVPAIGWIPVDPSFGDLAFPASFPEPENPREYYFGNLDSSRLAFLHGTANVGPDRRDGTHVSPEDPFTQQKRYLEAGPGVVQFEGEWLAPRLVALRQW